MKMTRNKSKRSHGSICSLASFLLGVPPSVVSGPPPLPTRQAKRRIVETEERLQEDKTKMQEEGDERSTQLIDQSTTKKIGEMMESPEISLQHHNEPSISEEATSPLRRKKIVKDSEMREREGKLRRLLRVAKKEVPIEPGQRIKVEVTKNNAPFGVHKDLYAQAITSGVRRYLDISMKSITCVPEHQKECVRRFVDARFDCAIDEKCWKQKLSKAFRESKQKACKAYFGKSGKPNWLHQDVWERLKALTHSKQFKVSCERNKLNRSVQRNTTNVGRKGMLGLKEKLAMELERSPSQKELFIGAHTSLGYGKAKRGELSSFGSSLMGSNDCVEMPTNECQSRASSKNRNNFSHVSKCKRSIMNDFELGKELEEKAQMASSQNVSLIIGKNSCSSKLNAKITTPSSQDTKICSSKKVIILDAISKKSVGLGTVMSEDPCFRVHTVPIGIGFAAVKVEEAFNIEAKLFIGNEELQYLGETIGLNVAWPISYLKYL